MKSFSQRKQIVPVDEIIQLNGMDDALRNSLWNVLDIQIWSSENFMYKKSGIGRIDSFSRALWFSYFKLPIDSRHPTSGSILKQIRKYFFECSWNQVYDFIEFVLAHFSTWPQLAAGMNHVLERELAGYRIINNQVVEITSTQEIEMLDIAIRDTRFAGVSSHLARALQLLADREQPDYRNSIKESISAVECIARVVAENPKAMLPDALKALEKTGRLHTALKDGFIKLYGYTSDADGIRHAMLDEPEINSADARFFLLSCTSFVQYLKAQLD